MAAKGVSRFSCDKRKRGASKLEQNRISGSESDTGADVITNVIIVNLCLYVTPIEIGSPFSNEGASQLHISSVGSEDTV